MKRQFATWGFFVTGVLWAVAGLRDVFAPGFFNISPQVASKADIIVNFALAAVFFTLAGFASRGGFDRGPLQK